MDDRTIEALGLFSADERDILAQAMGEYPDLVQRLLQAKVRANRRAGSDTVTDSARRILVGARLPRATAEQYRQAAAACGVSLYRFVCNALRHEYYQVMG